MKIIVIPHSIWTKIPTRAEYFINHFKKNHEVHLITWSMPYPLKFKSIFQNINKSREKYSQKIDKNLFVHHVSRDWIFPPFNNNLFKKQIKEIIAEYGIDTIFSESFIFDFIPPFEDIPVFYDMVDDHLSFFKNASVSQKIIGKIGRVNKATMEQLKHSSKTFFVSSVLEELYEHYTSKSAVLPNGVDIKKYKNSEPDKYIEKYNLNNFDVVMGCVGYFGEWSNLYNLFNFSNKFLKENNGVMVIVGIGPEVDYLKQKFKDNKRLIFTGMLNSNEIPSIIKSFDIGLIPFIKYPYKDAASPIKYFEYAAAGISVISTPLEEVKRINFNNTIFCEDIKNISTSFKEAIDLNFDKSRLENELKSYDWNLISDKLLMDMKYYINGV